MTLTKPVVVPFEGPLTKGNFVRRTDRFTAHLVLDGIERAAAETIFCGRHRFLRQKKWRAARCSPDKHFWTVY